ncbi:putative ankyrin repeat-containing domain-containing protein [Helianthus anomalus]
MYKSSTNYSTQDELILDRVSLTRVSETPLHIAALRGHNDFAKILLHKKTNTCHVPRLVKANATSLGRSRAPHGRTPLYLAAKNEQLEIIKLLIETKPDICKELQDNGDTILHTCICYNRFEAFKLLCL